MHIDVIKRPGDEVFLESWPRSHEDGVHLGVLVVVPVHPLSKVLLGCNNNLRANDTGQVMQVVPRYIGLIQSLVIRRMVYRCWERGGVVRSFMRNRSFGIFDLRMAFIRKLCINLLDSSEVVCINK